MSPLLALLVAGLVPAAEPETAAPLRYVLLVEGRSVPAGEVNLQRTPEGVAFTRTSEHDGARVTLTLHLDGRDQLVSAQTTQATARATRTAVLTRQGDTAQLKRAGITDFLEVPAHVVVTPAPEWSDAYQLLYHYDARKGGRQEFAALVMHPTERLQNLKVSLEHEGTDTVTVKDQRLSLERYRMRLPDGAHVVWVDPDGRLCKVLPPGAQPAPVVLAGFEEATRELH